MKKVIILGGGFAGVRCALDLAKRFSSDTEITLIDRNSYHLFTPALYEIASAAGIKKDPYAVYLRKTIAIPFSDIFFGLPVKICQTELQEVNLQEKTVIAQGGETLSWDYLVISLGSQSSDFGIKGVQEYAYQFKMLEEGLMIQQKLELLVKEVGDGIRSLPIKVGVIGGGFTGVELASEIACYLAKSTNIRSAHARSFQITLFEGSPHILPMITDAQRRSVIKRLTNLGVMVMENSMIEEVEAEQIKLTNGQQYHADLIAWTAGIKPNIFLKKINGLPLNTHGKIVVDEYLRVKDWAKVFAAGDNVEYIDPSIQRPVPAMAYIAATQASIVAKNVYRQSNSESLIKYRPSSITWIMPIGGKFAVANVGGQTVRGVTAWLLRKLLDLKYLLSILSVSKALRIFKSELIAFTKND